VILLILCLLASVPLSRLTFKDQERLATHNAICKYYNLKSTLAFVVPALPFLDPNSSISSLYVCTSFEIFK
jgi:hypothetical protein